MNISYLILILLTINLLFGMGIFSSIIAGKNINQKESRVPMKRVSINYQIKLKYIPGDGRIQMQLR